jgi:hypothetical protein
MFKMKITNKIFVGIAMCSLFISCNSEAESKDGDNTQEGSNQSETVIEEVTYSLLPETAEVKWIGYKLAEKVGVNGAFKNFSLTGYSNNAASIKDLMIGSEITIEVASTKTGDEARDGKIVNSFFGTMAATENIVAELISLSGEDAGTAVVKIVMNGLAVEKELNWSYTKDNSTFLLNGNINVPDWDAQAALDALNLVCEEKHRGDGDVAVTWADVDVSAFVLIEENTK